MDGSQEYNRVIDYIISEIDNGRLIEGSRLPAERELTEKLDISRNSTREALSILRGLGLVESKAGSGNYIVNNADKSIEQMMRLMLMMGTITKQELSDYRRFISRAVGSELLEKGIKPEYQRRIEEILLAMQDASNEEFCVLDREFHMTLMEATENMIFIKSMKPMINLYLDIIEDVFHNPSEYDIKIRIPMHENIYRSINNKDTGASIRYIREHYDFVDSKIKL